MKQPQFFQNTECYAKLKILKLWTKIISFGCFELQFSKAIVTFEISAFEFIKLQSYVQKLKFLKLGPKMPYLGVLGSNFEKLLSYLKSVPRIYLIVNFGAKIRNT